MAKKSVEKRHSETAIFAALYRAVANKEYINTIGPDYLAEYFLPPHFKFFIRFKKIRINVKNKSDRYTPGTFEYMITRTLFFDNVFKEALSGKTPQIVLLGGGYDTRAYRFAELNNHTKVFDLDIATTQDRKKKCLKKAGIDGSEQVIFVPINFNKESLKNALEKAGYRKNEEALFIWEGVSYYIEQEAVDATFEFVSKHSHNESHIAFDYVITVPDENMNEYYGVKEFTETWRKHRPNEAFKFTMEENMIGPYLEKRGLKIIKNLDNREIEKIFLTDKTPSLSQITGFFRFAIASPYTP